MTKTPFALTSAIALAAALAAGSAVAQYGGSSQSMQSETGNTMGQTSRMEGNQQSNIGTNNQIAQWAQGKQVKDLTGESLYDISGSEKIGEITHVVRDKQSNQPFAVVSAQGGVLGLGAKKVVIPLSNLAMQNNKLIDQSVVNAEQLKQQQAYNDDQYSEVSSDQNLSEFAAFEQHQGGSSQSGSIGTSSFNSQSNQGQSSQGMNKNQ